MQNKMKLPQIDLLMILSQTVQQNWRKQRAILLKTCKVCNPSIKSTKFLRLHKLEINHWPLAESRNIQEKLTKVDIFMAASKPCAYEFSLRMAFSILRMVFFVAVVIASWAMRSCAWAVSMLMCSFPRLASIIGSILGLLVCRIRHYVQGVHLLLFLYI